MLWNSAAKAVGGKIAKNTASCTAVQRWLRIHPLRIENSGPVLRHFTNFSWNCAIPSQFPVGNHLRFYWLGCLHFLLHYIPQGFLHSSDNQETEDGNAGRDKVESAG